MQNATQEDADGDSFGASCDCNDGNAMVSPEAPEICDDFDNNCDGEIDEGSAVGASDYFADADGDGEGDAEAPISACEQPPATVTNSADCDDTDPNVSTNATEVCDDVDNDCDGQVDNDFSCESGEAGGSGAGGCGCDTGEVPVGSGSVLVGAALALTLRRRRR